jgi:membrane protease YdiL (CAAX protease family)
MKPIFKITAYIIGYTLLFYFFALNIPILLEKTIPSIATNKNVELTDLIAEILAGAIVLLPVYYYRRQYIRISSKLNIKRLLLYILAVLVADYLIYSLFIHHTFEVNFVFRFDNTVLLKWVFYFLRAIIINAIVLELLYRGILIEYLLVKKIRPIWIVLFSASLFGFIYLFFYGNFIPCFSFGILSTLIYLKERNVTYCIFLNVVWNFIIFYVMNWNI